jgi:hypothetical protein
MSVARAERGNNNPNSENSEIPDSASCPFVTGKGKSINQTSKSRSREYQLSLKIWLDVMVEDKTFSIPALIDTSAEINIIKRVIIPQEYLRKDSNLLVLRGQIRPSSKEETYAYEVWGYWRGKPLQGNNQSEYNAASICIRQKSQCTPSSHTNGWRIRIYGPSSQTRIVFP